MLPISERAASLGTENAFVVLKDVLARAAAGADIKNFCIGQPDFVTPDAIRLAAVRALIEGKTGYTPSAGIPELREAIAASVRRTRGLAVDADDVVVACGAKPFIGYAIQTVTDPGAGHEVIFPVPGFPIYQSQILAQGAVPVPLPLRERNGFRPDPEELASKLGPRTRLVILNSPHNPTGSLMSTIDVEAIAQVLAPYEDVWIFSDEPYASLAFDGGASPAAHPALAARTLLVDGASKTYAMPGWRIGWAIHRELAPILARWVTNTESCAPHLSQWAVVEALNGSQRDALAMRDAFARRRDVVVQALDRTPGIRCLKPGGAFYAWPNVTELCRLAGARDSEALRRRLLDEAGVALLSDVHFGPRIPGEGEHLRLSFAASLPDLEEGLRRIDDFARAAVAASAAPVAAGSP
jgi:aspartate/methionine/tyrosine aminotransferase